MITFFIIGTLVFALQSLSNRNNNQITVNTGLIDAVMRWESDILKYSLMNDVPAYVVAGQIAIESSGNPRRVGDNGDSIGLMQLQRDAVDDAGFDPDSMLLTDPKINLMIGTAYLKLQIGRMGSLQGGLRAYNGGETGAKRNPKIGYEYAISAISVGSKIWKTRVHKGEDVG